MIAPAVRLRRTIGALSLPTIFLVILVGTPLLDPLDGRANETTTLGQAVGHGGQIAALGWAEILTGILLIAGLMTVVGAIRARGSGWASATGLVAVFSAVGLVALAMNHFLIAGLVQSNLTTDQRIEALTQFHHAGGPIAVLIMITALGFVTAAVAAWRSGISSPLVLVPAVALFLVSFAPGDAAEYASQAAGLITGTWLARDLLRQHTDSSRTGSRDQGKRLDESSTGPGRP